MSKKSPVKAALFATVVVVGVIVLLAPSGSHKTASAYGTPSHSKQAQRFVATEGADANRVAASIANVEVSVGILSLDAKKGVDISADLASVAQVAQGTEDNLTVLGNNLAVASDGTGQIQTLEESTGVATDDFKAAMKQLLQLAHNPTDAAQAGLFTQQLATATSEWNAAVEGIWAAAGVTPVPTVGS